MSSDTNHKKKKKKKKKNITRERERVELYFINLLCTFQIWSQKEYLDNSFKCLEIGYW